MNSTSLIAEFIAKSRWEECPAPAVEAARRAILDCLGVMLAGSIDPPARIVQAVAEAEGGAPLATVVGTGRRTGAVWAALANGTAAHALDFDDTNFAMLGHPSAPVLAAALAAGELALADGRAVVHAFLLGFEVETTLAEAMNPAHYEHGWHATCTLGTIGAAAAAARLLGLDPDQTQMTLAVAASQASGLKENFGTMTKPLHAGHAARSGVLAALLAREGFTASPSALDGTQGFTAAFGGRGTLEEALDRLGRVWHAETSRIAVKPYPSCAMTHPAIDALVELRDRERLRPEQIADVEVAVNPVTPDVLRHHRPTTGLERKFSMQYCAAAALADGRVDLDSYADEEPAEPVRALMARVRMVVTDDLPHDLEQNAWSRVTVRLVDGRTLALPPRGAQGHPDTPLTDVRLRDKFLACAALAMPRDEAEGVAEQLAHLEDIPDIRVLTSRLAGATH